MNGLAFRIVLAVAALASVSQSRESHECSRPCDSVSEDTARICRYKFVVGRSTSYAGGDSDEGFVGHVVNGSSPGPPIEVCLGDTIVVIVENKLSSEEVSFHWHGLHHRGSPHMDGVPMISQCPILPYTRLRYEIKPENTGTYFYHAHEVRQQGDGLYGSLTVRGPSDDPGTEKILLVSARPSGPLTRLIHLEERIAPRSLTLNGQVKDVDLKVESKRKYRLRLVNANVFDCPIAFFVDRHSLNVVAVDARPVAGGDAADRVLLFPGERFDLIVEANQKPGSYVVGLQGFGDCRGLVHEAHLIYDDGDSENSWQFGGNSPTVRDGSFVEEFEGEIPIHNCHEGVLGGMKTVCSLDLRGTFEEEEEDEEEEEIETYYVPFDVQTYDDITDEMTDYTFNIYDFSYFPSFLSTKVNATRIAQINRMTFDYPPSPILSQPELVEDDKICTIDERSKSCNQDDKYFCQCTQILQLPAWKTVDIVLIDQGFGGNASHTFHVHGYHARIIGIGEFGRPVTREEIIRSKNEATTIPRKFSLQKDSFVVPNKGYLVLRLRTDNIGYWLWEARSTGVEGNGPPMQFVMQVGNRENLPTVPIDFPTCGSHKGPASIFEDND